MNRRASVLLIASALAFLNSGSLAHARVDDPEFDLIEFNQNVWGEEDLFAVGFGYMRGQGSMSFPVGYEIDLRYTGLSSTGAPVNIPVQLSNPYIVNGVVYVSWEFAVPVPSGTYEMDAVVVATSMATGEPTTVKEHVGFVVVPSM